MNTTNTNEVEKMLKESLDYMIRNHKKYPGLWPHIDILYDAMKSDKLYKSMKEEGKNYVNKVFNFSSSITRMLDFSKTSYENVYYDLVKPYRSDIDGIIRHEKESREILGDELYEKIKKKKYKSNEEHANTMRDVLDKLEVNRDSF